MSSEKAFPLDLARTAYSYVERANPALLALLSKHVLTGHTDARILDIGCGCGANALAIKEQSPRAYITGIEPSPRAADLARKACDDVFEGMLQDWAALSKEGAPYDAVLLSDVLEHIADPIAFLRTLTAIPALQNATWVISVPNYAVWYNRARTLFGMQGYSWSGLWDRTHLRFFTGRSVRQLLEYCDLTVIDRACTPSLVQSAAPVLRKLFDRKVEEGDHLALAESGAYKLYRNVVEPAESKICEMWPDLLGFQVVHAVRLKRS